MTAVEVLKTANVVILIATAVVCGIAGEWLGAAGFLAAASFAALFAGAVR